MGLLSFGVPKEKRTQLFFRGDGRFEFRRMELEDAILVEKNKEGEVTSGWPHFYQAQYPFPGYKNIPADMVTLSHARDIILDPHKLVPINELPDIKPDEKRKSGNNDNMKTWLANIGKASRLKIMAKRSKTKATDKIIVFLGTALMLQIVILLITVAKGAGS